MPILEPVGLRLWDDLKAEGLQWPQTDEDMLGELAAGWNSAAGDFDRVGGERHDVTGVWADAAGVQMTGKMAKLSEETRLVGGDMRVMGGYLDEAARATADAKAQISVVISSYNRAYEIAIAMVPRGVLSTIVLFVVMTGLFVGTLATAGPGTVVAPAPIIIFLLAAAAAAIRAAATQAVKKAITEAAKRAAKPPAVRPPAPRPPAPRTPPTPSGVKPGWTSRPADNGKGTVYQRPGATGNADSTRIMNPTPQYPHGYVRFYNQHGQPIGLNGKPGPHSQTHIPIRPDGTYPVPQGW